MKGGGGGRQVGTQVRGGQVDRQAVACRPYYIKVRGGQVGRQAGCCMDCRRGRRRVVQDKGGT